MAKIPPEPVFIQFFIGCCIPQPASIRGNFIRQNDPAMITAKFNFKVNQANAFCLKIGF